jgi:hypothetical protein
VIELVLLAGVILQLLTIDDASIGRASRRVRAIYGACRAASPVKE